MITIDSKSLGYIIRAKLFFWIAVGVSIGAVWFFFEARYWLFGGGLIVALVCRGVSGYYNHLYCAKLIVLTLNSDNLEDREGVLCQITYLQPYQLGILIEDINKVFDEEPQLMHECQVAIVLITEYLKHNRNLA